MTLEELRELAQPEALAAIKDNLKMDAGEFALKHSGDKSLPVRAIAEQIDLRKKAQNKFPTFTKKEILFEREAFEQSSGEVVAGYKRKLISGKRIIDITGGLGIDLAFLSANFEESYYCERNEVLCELFAYNRNMISSGKIEILQGDSIESLQKFPDGYFTWLFADPARREQGRRSVDLTYCSPNVIEHKNLLFQKAENVLLKLSPAFEYAEAVKLFPELSEFIVISVEGECKEVLLLLSKDKQNEEVKIKAVVLTSGGAKAYEIESHGLERDRVLSADITGYFYEPDAAVIKSRLTYKLAEKYNVEFINSDTDYLVSQNAVAGFPGRSFNIINVWEYKPKQIITSLKELGITKANVARRSFPLSVEELRSKLKLKDGGEDYLFFTRNYKGELVCIYCKK